MSRILIIEDVAALAEQYAYDLARLGGFVTAVAATAGEALESIGSDEPDCIILDLELPGTDGFEILTTLKENGVEAPVIVYTGTGSYDRCVRAVKLGAYSFIDKAEPIERVVREVENALERTRLTREVSELRRRLGGETPIIGESGVMAQLLEEIARLAPIPSPVLVLGESGSGKELVARELHRMGGRPSGPFLAVNSAALPENLVESELFGHERGAFTGADRRRRGAFEAASGGTLFLDEIGELPAAAQAKLLRVLEESAVTRLGSTDSVRVDTRVVAATNRDLDEEISAGRFRKDLFFRLEVHTLHVPPLRDRMSDVPALIEHFLTELCSKLGMRRKSMTENAIAILCKYNWERNNVRELRNAVERAIIASRGDEIRAADVSGGASIGGGRSSHPTESGSLRDLKAAAERAILLAALERNGWHITNTASDLGLSDHSSLLKIMRRHGIKRDA